MNVKDSPWKAIGNGIDDDYIPLQRAITAMGNSGGGEVFLPTGKYSISGTLLNTYPNVYLIGDGAASIIPKAIFAGDSVICYGKASGVLTPTYRGGIENITVDLSQNNSPNLVGVKLIQTWFTRLGSLRIFNPNGLRIPIQTGFVIDSGSLIDGAANWASNNSINDLQISGSFQTAIAHTSATPGGMVNGTNYFGGFAYGAGQDKLGTCAVRIESGDSTRMYGFAIEDWDLGISVSTPNNGPFDVRMEGVNIPYSTTPGITFTVPTLTNKP